MPNIRADEFDAVFLKVQVKLNKVVTVTSNTKWYGIILVYPTVRPSMVSIPLSVSIPIPIHDRYRYRSVYEWYQYHWNFADCINDI
jgi:hypothetical protein